MPDAMLRLALGMHAGPGVYAVLLGSGVSRPAAVPTGWEVVIDLIRRVAAAEGAHPEPDPAVWYAERYGSAPEYTDLLEVLTGTSAERGQLLRRYFEPDREERERGERLPTAAHRALARLVRDGFVRVIVTTNFDRLTEQALVDEGVQPTVISSVDDIAGASSLPHARAMVVKVHGDYLDARIRNTADELAGYEPEMCQLLARVFTDFGLVVVGWSGAYDTALCDLLAKHPNHSQGTYWTARGEAHDAARTVIDAREADMIRVRDADKFFTELEQKVAALQAMARAGPISAAMAAQRVKTYVVEDRHRIALHDLSHDEVDRLLARIGPHHFPVHGVEHGNEQFLGRLADYEALTENAFAIIATGTRWGPDHLDLWTDMIERVLNASEERSGLTMWIELQRYPALLLLYGAGLGAVAGGNEQLVSPLLTQPRRRDRDEAAHQQLIAYSVVHHDVMTAAYRAPGGAGYKTPVSQYLHDRLRDWLRPLLRDDEQFTEAFDRFEYLAALVQAHRNGATRGGWFFIGSYAWRADRRMSALIDAEIEQARDRWPLVAAGEFDGDLARLREVKKHVDEKTSHIAWPWG